MVKIMKENVREYQKAVDCICSEIGNGSISVGDRLPTERMLAEKLGISRNSTREALRSLENMGIVESVRGSGNYYTGNVSKKFTQMIRTLLLIKLVSKKDICDFRRTMELSVCMTIINKEDIDYSKIKQILDIKPTNETEEVDKDKMFHYYLAMCSENVFWIAIMNAVIDVYREWIDEIIKKIDENTKEKLNIAHKSILKSIMDKDKINCEKAINLHYDIIDGVLGYM